MRINAPIHHFGYSVDSLDTAIPDFAERFSIGPFFVIKDVQMNLSSRGEPAVFEHSSAFAKFGDAFIELMEIGRCEPARVRKAMDTDKPALDHVAYAVDNLANTSRALEGAGAPAYLHATLGEIEFIMHDATGTCGHSFELHANSDGFRQMFERIARASADWDRTDLVRHLP